MHLRIEGAKVHSRHQCPVPFNFCFYGEQNVNYRGTDEFCERCEILLFFSHEFAVVVCLEHRFYCFQFTFYEFNTFRVASFFRWEICNIFLLLSRRPFIIPIVLCMWILVFLLTRWALRCRMFAEKDTRANSIAGPLDLVRVCFLHASISFYFYQIRFIFSFVVGASSGPSKCSCSCFSPSLHCLRIPFIVFMQHLTSSIRPRIQWWPYLSS